MRELQKEITTESYIKNFDISSTEAINLLEDLIQEMNGVELIIISAGCGIINPDLDFDKEKETIDVNVSGFVAMTNVAFKHFVKQGVGLLWAYHQFPLLEVAEMPLNIINASKAFVSNYLEGLRQKVHKLGLPITITDIQTGFVDTAMAQWEGLFWVASPVKAALQTYKAIATKKNHAYITKRWRIIAWLLKTIPSWLYNKL